MNESNQQLLGNTQEFFGEQWKLYQKVIINNYMEHEEFYDCLHKFLVSQLQQPFTMLDLGCGDAHFIGKALLHTAIADYTGVDLSAPALAIADENLKFINCQKTFIQGDFYTIVPELMNNKIDEFDLIFASFSLHHLSIEQKDDLIAKISQLLKEKGIFIIIDAMRREDENRDTYINRYLENVRQEWTLMTPEEITMVDTHISSSDFPETQSTLFTLASKNGFSNGECLYSDRHDTEKFLCFYKRSLIDPLKP